MMRVTVEILPYGDELRLRRMVTMNIANVSSGFDEVADYDIEAVLNPGQVDEKRIGGKVLSHDRALGYSPLVARAIALVEPHTKWRKGPPQNAEETMETKCSGCAPTVRGIARHKDECPEWQSAFDEPSVIAVERSLEAHENVIIATMDFDDLESPETELRAFLLAFQDDNERAYERHAVKYAMAMCRDRLLAAPRPETAPTETKR